MAHKKILLDGKTWLRYSISVWNDLSYLDGILFTIWLGILYYGKCWIDSKFK